MKSTTQIFKPLLRGAFLALAFAALGQAAAQMLPTATSECFNGGWQKYAVFKNQGDCVSFVATKGKNPPAKAPPPPPPTTPPPPPPPA